MGEMNDRQSGFGTGGGYRFGWRDGALLALLVLILAITAWLLLWRDNEPSAEPVPAVPSPAAIATNPQPDATPVERPVAEVVRQGGQGGGTELPPELADQVEVRFAGMRLSRQVALADRQGSEQFQVYLHVRCRGKVQPMSCEATITTAVTDGGEQLAQIEPGNGAREHFLSPMVMFGVTGGEGKVRSSQVTANLVPPRKPLRGLKQLSGEVAMRYTAGEETVELSRCAAGWGAPRTIPGWRPWGSRWSWRLMTRARFSG